MSNEFYSHTTYPANSSSGSSSAMRAELDLITAGFAKLPTMAGNGSKLVAINSGATALVALATTGTGSAVLATSPTLTTPTFTAPVLGTPASGVLTNCTGLPLTTGVTGTLGVTNGGTGVTTSTGSGANALATSPTLVTPLLGTPTSGTLTNCTGLPISSGVSGLGTGVATFLATPSSANLIAAVTDETGTGALVFATSPTLASATLTAPVLGTPASGTLTNCTGLPVSTGVSGLAVGVATFLATPSSANLIAAVTDETGTGALVFGTSPTLTTPNIGTPSAGTLTNCTGLPISTGVSGLAAGVATFLATPSSANLKAAVTDETGSGALVFATSPTFTTGITVSGDVATTNVSATGFIATTSAFAGLGYLAGSGGTVTQLTSKSTGVTVNKSCGQITMNNAALASGAKVSFAVASVNSANDVVLVQVASGGTANAYRAEVTAAAVGTFTVTVENITAGSLSEAPVIGFMIFKGQVT